MRNLSGRDIDVVWTLRFNLAYNSGAAFSRWARAAGRWIAVVAVAHRRPADLAGPRTCAPALAAVALGLIVGGALGNLVDRAFRAGDGGFLGGSVVDFIDVQWWPVFNVADMGVVVGAILLVVSSFLAVPDDDDARGAAGAADDAATAPTAPSSDSSGADMGVVETVPGPLDGERIDRVVAMVTGASRARSSTGSTPALVRVNGAVATSRSARLVEGDVVEVDVDLDARGRGRSVPEPDVEVPVVYVDDDVIVIDKPAGLVVHPGAGNTDRHAGPRPARPLPRDRRASATPTRPGIVHRLDKDTSGLLLVARTPGGLRGAGRPCSPPTRSSARYLALVWGIPEARSGMVDAPIGRSHPRAHPHGRQRPGQARPAPATTSCAPSTDPAPCSLLECRLETGRTHQIRVHLAAIGHPVVGDARYRRREAVDPGAAHWCCTSAALALDHPTRTGERAVVRVAAAARPRGRARRAQREPAHGGVTTGAASSPGQVASPRAMVTMSARVAASR